MARCACGTAINNDECACLLGSTDAVAVTGSGAVGDPYLSSLVLDPDDGNTASVSASGLFVPGMIVATSAERPGIVPAAGVRVLLDETDTDLVWKWNGTTWKRLAPKGLIGFGSRDTSYSNATTSYTNVIGASAHVPDGGRVLQIAASWPKAENTAGSFRMGIKRTDDDGSNPEMLTSWTGSGDSTSPTAGAGGQGGSYLAYEGSGLPEGDYKWYLVARCVSGIDGTTVIDMDTDITSSIAVTEI